MKKKKKKELGSTFYNTYEKQTRQRVYVVTYV